MVLNPTNLVPVPKISRRIIVLDLVQVMKNEALKRQISFLIFICYFFLFLLRCSDLCLIFTELCNALSYYMINEPNHVLGDLNTINLLLMCGSHKEYEVFQKSFIFWFNISEEIYTNENSEKLCLQFRNLIYTLVDCICVHCCLDSSHANIPPGKNDEFGEFRIKASDLVADVVFIVEANKCFEKVIYQNSS